MKKLISLIASVLIVGSMASCYIGNEESKSTSKSYGIGDTQTIDGIDITVTEVKSAKYYKNIESRRGKWVAIAFDIVDKNDKEDTIFSSDFTLNDTYTVREYSYRHSEFGGGLSTLNNGTVYHMWLVFDCSYGHEEKDMVFTYTDGVLFGGTYKWVI
jgi:hypothetical protein